VEITEEDYLAHYGILRRSGRYPWGSGGTQLARNRKFLDIVEEYRKQGYSDTEICRFFDIKDKDGNITESFSTTQLRAAKSIAKNEIKQSEITTAQQLKAKGMSNIAIGERMGKNESSVRALLSASTQDKANILHATAEMLKGEVAEKKFVQIGKGVESHIGVSENMLANSVAVLKEQGYTVHSVPIEQLGTGKQTNVKVLAPPGTTWGDVKRGQSDIKLMGHFSEDGGRTFLGLHPPISISPKRVQVKYEEDGGAALDGVMFVRPGVKDVNIGGSSYAQVRVSVGKEHYLKGMAMYKDDLPDGVDIQFNTNKSRDSVDNDLDAMKKVNRKEDGSIDTDNPYGANIKRQIVEKVRGKEKVTSAMNIVNEEGNWSDWSKSLSSQMLSKQSPALAKAQLDLTFKQREEEFKRISELTNPTVRKKLLEEFGDGTDSAAVRLQAAAIPRTHGHHVILPITSMPPTQIYAPNYRDGERVALIRHPHGGTFEIPELTVNNKHPEAVKLLGQAKDAVGIHHSVAERLSGADFDGDTVLVIPNNTGRVKTTPALEGLKNFDPRREYPPYPGMKPMTAAGKGKQMGDITNLISDMTVKGASTSEIARAVRHSMVVIDAEKHNLNYKESAIRNGIPQLKEKYQGKKNAGAGTLISRAGSKDYVPDFEPRKQSLGGSIDPKTGKRIYDPTGKGRTNEDGSFTPKLKQVKKLAITDDAHTLSSGTRIEKLYADHSNRLKSLANSARKASVNTPPSVYSPSAAKAYKAEVAKLKADLDIARRNAPLERQAQVLANTFYRQKLQDNPTMDDATKKKVRYQALNEARTRTGAGKKKIIITPEGWNAIQAGAISNHMLNQILTNADMDVVRDLATPRKQKLMTPAKVAQAKALLAKGFTRAEVSDRLGVSLTTLDEGTNG
jgi:hypothetical protein